MESTQDNEPSVGSGGVEKPLGVRFRIRLSVVVLIIATLLLLWDFVPVIQFAMYRSAIDAALQPGVHWQVAEAELKTTTRLRIVRTTGGLVVGWR